MSRKSGTRYSKTSEAVLLIGIGLAVAGATYQLAVAPELELFDSSLNNAKLSVDQGDSRVMDLNFRPNDEAMLIEVCKEGNPRQLLTQTLGTMYKTPHFKESRMERLEEIASNLIIDSKSCDIDVPVLAETIYRVASENSRYEPNSSRIEIGEYILGRGKEIVYIR